jgi:cyclohexanecarboxylate-CoA ligase
VFGYSWKIRASAVLEDRIDDDQSSGFEPDQGRIARERESGFWPDKTIIDYFERSLASRPASDCLIAYRSDTAECVSLSFSKLAGRVARIAANLGRLGVRRGDIVSFQIPNWWQFIAVHLACVRIGAISNPLMPIFRDREVEFMVRSCGSRVLIVPKVFRKYDHENLAARIQENVSTLQQVIVIDGDDENSFDAVLLGQTNSDSDDELNGLQPNDIMKIMFTSGTTGEPKGVMHTSNTILSSMPTLTGRLGLTGDDVIFMPSPFGHSIGFCYGILMSFFLGARLITMDVWNPEKAVEIMERHGVTFMFGATPFVSDIVNFPGIERRRLDQFRIFLTAGAPIPPSPIDKGKSVLTASIVPGYGMTELGLASSILPTALDRGYETDGVALPHVELRVADGELQCRGSSLFVGYHGRPDLYEIDDEGWFDTGDLATMDSDGYIRIVGRSKDIIIRGGENIPVVEVEYLIHEMPQVIEVAIVGMPDERLGERSCAFVSLHEGHNLSLDQVTAHLESRSLARQYFPEKLVVIDKMPTTPAGKLQKFRLRDLVS